MLGKIYRLENLIIEENCGNLGNIIMYGTPSVHLQGNYHTIIPIFYLPHAFFHK